jgi:hypothetical protein
VEFTISWLLLYVNNSIHLMIHQVKFAKAQMFNIPFWLIKMLWIWQVLADNRLQQQSKCFVANLSNAADVVDLF